jgi:hypothetical protein
MTENGVQSLKMAEETFTTMTMPGECSTSGGTNSRNTMSQNLRINS